MEQSLELRGHDRFVGFLTTVRTHDGRVLLVSADTHGSQRVWDPLTGESVCGPIKRGESKAELAALRLDSVELARATGCTVVPATERTPALAVTTADRKRIQVLEPEGDSVVFQLRQPRDRRIAAGLRGGLLGPGIFELAGVRFADGTSGFAAARFNGVVELWAPARRPSWAPLRLRWRRHILTHGRNLAVLNLGSGGSHLAVHSSPQVIVVWDVTTHRQVARFDLWSDPAPRIGWSDRTPRISAMAPVPLDSGPVLAVVVERGPDSGVQLCDPYRGQLVGEVFNRHGPRPDYPSADSAILALTALPGPKGTVRIASGGQDGVIRISAPIGKASDTAFAD